MPDKMIRVNDSATYTVTNSLSTTAKIPFGAAAGGIIIVPSGGITGAASTLTWYVMTGPEATPVALLDSGTAVTTTIAAGNAYTLPDALFAAPFVVPLANQGSVSMTLCVKS